MLFTLIQVVAALFLLANLSVDILLMCSFVEPLTT